MDTSKSVPELASWTARTDRALDHHQGAELFVVIARAECRKALEKLERVPENRGESTQLSSKFDDPHAGLHDLVVGKIQGSPVVGHRPAKSTNAAEIDKLTAREGEVLKLIVDGNSTKEIAANLKIAFKTAACHRANIMSKFGTSKSSSLVRIAIQRGLVEA